ncbi:hypothetical protein [Coralloluteibacterium thermophilus]|uniref:Uncharacterized protein n=1 Tax=Coralloluteibacterium thermophilum TaxID=2707049 RepID=A0ABV9NL84_9GAMM
MNTHPALFRLKLPNGQTVGPRTLKALWGTACESSDVSVGRRMEHGDASQVDSYLLCGAPGLLRGTAVEERLRTALERAGLLGVLVRLGHD